MRLVLSCLWAGLLCALLVGPAAAQVGERPSDRRPDPGGFADDEAPRLRLPAPLPPTPGTWSGIQVVVSGFRFRGNTVFSAETLSKVTSSWLARPIDFKDLTDAADAVTRLYNDAGYLSSGAFVPDQDANDGTVLLQVVEGTVSQINVVGARWFRKSYFRSRLVFDGPVNVHDLEQRLQLLQQDSQIQRIDARLTPAVRRGESVLSLEV